ncbi:MAG: polysaccharide biosynthesis tyrosine autokinase [Verrucomicrobiota bacterium]
MEAVPPLPQAKDNEAQLHFLDYWRILRVRKVLIMVVFLLVVTTTTVITFWLPKTYLSAASIAVDKDLADVSLIPGRQMQTGFDMFFIQTQFERIQSSEVLDKVIEDKELNLNERWAKRFGMERPLETRETYNILSKRLRVRNVRNTTIIEIGVISEDKKEAAEIANKIVQVYRTIRQDRVLRYATSSIAKYKEEENALNAEVEQLQKDVDRLRQEAEISDFGAGGAMVQILDTETLRTWKRQQIEYSAVYEKLRTQLDQLKRVKEEELPTAVQQNNFSEQLAALLLNRNEMLTKKSTSTEFSPTHPEMIKLEAGLAENKKLIEKTVKETMLGLQVSLDAAKAQSDELTTQVEKAKQADLAMQAKSIPYAQKKRDLEDKMEVRRLFQFKTRQEEFEASLPRLSMVEDVSKATPALTPYRPNVPLNIALGIVVGLVVGVGLAFFVEYLDTSMKTIDDVELALQAPVVGVIPQNVGPLFEEGEDSPHAEAYRVLRTNLLFGRKDERLNTITVVSGGAGEGKSTTIMNIATIFAQNGHRILLVDTDLRRPSLHKAFNVSNSIGLTSFLLGQRTLEETIQKTQVKNLDFLPSGRLPASAMGILNSPQMKDFVNDVKARYDFVFFDAPPILGVSDASILVSMMDMTLLVVQYRKYPQPMTVRAKLTIDKVGGNLLGVVLNNINLSSDSYYYYHSGYHYNHYARSDDSLEEKEATKPVTPKKADEEKVSVKQKY